MTIQDVQITSRGAAPAVTGGCSCCSSTATVERAPRQRAASETTARHLVGGMTCGSCASVVTRELSALEGVTGVDIDLVAGGTSTVTVTSTRPLPLTAVAAAVTDAGYSLVVQS